MSARPIVDSVDFARRRGDLRGEVKVADLERLREALFDTQGAVEFTLNGLIDADGKPNLWLELQAEVQLTCSRCLGSLTLPVHVRKRFVLTRPDEDPGDVSDEALDVEHIPADAALDVISLVEDELMLGLPMSAAHETGQCAPGAWNTGAAEADSPFVSLAGLKQAPGTEK
jgi:uncharacterized protein